MEEKRKQPIRQRPVQVKFFVDEKELAIIKQRMTTSGADNLSAYLRTMAMEGTFPIAGGEASSKQKKRKVYIHLLCLLFCKFSRDQVPVTANP